MEQDNDTLLKLKQDLLKTEILEQNYDKEKFLDYCISKKENGDDLSCWTYEELRETVGEFTKNPEYHTSFVKEKEIKKPNEVNKEINVDIEKIKIYNSRNEEKYLLKEIYCKKLEKSFLNDKEIKVVLRNPKIIEAGFFSSNYVTYEVHTEITNWQTRRRYSDFEWLRTILTKSFPGHLIPPLPFKKIGSRRFEQDFINKRLVFLTKFLNVICESEYFKTSEALIAFLSYTDRIIFENKMKELSGILQPQYVEDYKTFEGKVQIVDDEENEKYYQNINNYFNIQIQLYDRINYSLKNFAKNITNACINLEEISKDFNTLEILNSRVLMVKIYIYLLKEDINKCYGELSGFFKNWSRVILNQNDIVKHKVKDFFKYVRMENYAFLDNLKIREDMKTKYNFELLKVNYKKEKLWTQMDITKWEINEEAEKIDKALMMKDKNYAFQKMCYRDTNQLNNLHKKLAFYNKSIVNELRRMVNNHCLRYKDDMRTFLDEFYPTLTDVIFILIFIIIRASIFGQLFIQVSCLRKMTR